MAEPTPINTTNVMQRAWYLYKITWPAPRYEFDRVAFGVFLSRAWREAKLAAMPEQQQIERVADINRQIELSDYLPFNMSQSRRVSALREELRRAA